MDIEKRKRLPVSVSAAVYLEDDQGRLLLLKQAAARKGYRWGPPAGGMEAHEDPQMAAIREAQEEINVKVVLIDLIGIYTIDKGDAKSSIGFVFRGRISAGKITPQQDEISDYRFFSPQEIEKLIHQDQIYKPEFNLAVFRDWLKGCSFPLEIVQNLTKRR